MKTAQEHLLELQEIAQHRGGKCLADAYVKSNYKLEFECEKQHRWKTTPSRVKLGKWCPDCAGKNKSIDDLHKLAALRNGLCLSKSYLGSDLKHTWQCSDGHTWNAPPSRIKSGSWCPVCVGKNKSIDDLHKLARSRNGLCLSESFLGMSVKHTWQCDKQHRWEAVPSNIQSGSWCPTCAGNRTKTIDDANRIAKLKGGQCLSTHYVNSYQKLEFQCSEGHRWKTSLACVFQGTWCPNCRVFLGEKICREFFEQLLGMPFPKARPSWLKSARGKKMELDGYCEQLKIAFEHQGTQHYKRVKHFHSDKDFEAVQKRDLIKKELCAKHQITLIEVPSILETLGVDNLKDFIKNALQSAGFAIPCDFDSKEINLKAVYQVDALNELQEIAKKRNGKLLSVTYLGALEKLEWKCEKGHSFFASPTNVKSSNTWCPYCVGLYKTIEDMHRLAEVRGGKCLSLKYVNSKTHLMWQCSKAHQWIATPSKITLGTWCPHCAKEVQLKCLKEINAKRQSRSCDAPMQLSIWGSLESLVGVPV